MTAQTRCRAPRIRRRVRPRRSGRTRPMDRAGCRRPPTRGRARRGRASTGAHRSRTARPRTRRPRSRDQRVDQLGVQHVTALALEVAAEELLLPLELEIGLDAARPRDGLRVRPPHHRCLAGAMRGAEDARAPAVRPEVRQRPDPVAEPARRADVGDAVPRQHDVDPGLGLDAHAPERERSRAMELDAAGDRARGHAHRARPSERARTAQVAVCRPAGSCAPRTPPGKVVPSADRRAYRLVDVPRTGELSLMRA